jgi:protein-S-isoprenylcysteine O-methyltransferase Ste14
MTLVVIPAALVLLFGANAGWGLPGAAAALPVIAGVVLLFTGLGFLAWTVGLFAVFGRGTLAPWNPTDRLVVRGPYRHVRNPMISGVALALLGEAVLLGAPALLAWFALFFLANVLFIPLVEERGLEQRFGEDYLVYKRNVPAWVPRYRGWRPPGGPG